MQSIFHDCLHAKWVLGIVAPALRNARFKYNQLKDWLYHHANFPLGFNDIVNSSMNMIMITMILVVKIRILDHIS